jgi:hypothetical protein
MWDLGEAAKVAILSVTEGEDKPLKYPDMFAAAQLMVLNKTDLLPHLDFDVPRCIDYARRVNPGIEVLLVSAVTGDGMDAWLDWLERRAAETRAHDPTDGTPARHESGAAHHARLRRLAEERRLPARRRRGALVAAARRPRRPQACVALEASLQALLARAAARSQPSRTTCTPTSTAPALARRTGRAPGRAGHRPCSTTTRTSPSVHGRARLADGAGGRPGARRRGLGSDGLAWGGEVLCWSARRLAPRIGHLPRCDARRRRAAREPWRMAAAALHALGRGDEIVPRWRRQVGDARPSAHGQHAGAE